MRYHGGGQRGQNCEKPTRKLRDPLRYLKGKEKLSLKIFQKPLDKHAQSVYNSRVDPKTAGYRKSVSHPAEVNFTFEYRHKAILMRKL